MRDYSRGEQMVSVVLPCFKMGQFIQDAVDSIGTQCYRNWEVIAVDDGGPEDGTAQVVGNFASEHPNHRVSFIRHEQNQGVSAARNTGIAAAKGTLIAFLDPDDIWCKTHLELCMQAISRDPAVAVVAAPMRQFRGVPSNATGECLFQDWKIRLFPDSLAIHNFIQPSGVVAYRNAILDAGGFDTSLAVHEDHALWIRLVEYGYKFSFLREATFLYRRHQASATQANENVRRNAAAFAEQYRGELMRMQGLLLHDILERCAQSRTDLEGPMVSTLVSLDRLIAKVFKTFFGNEKR